jgi:hypothetical protein
MYTVFFISFVVSSTWFGWYLHPSLGTQLQRTVIGLNGFVLYSIGAGTSLGHLFTVTDQCLIEKVSQTSTCSNGITHKTIQIYTAVRCSCAPDDRCK